MSNKMWCVWQCADTELNDSYIKCRSYAFYAFCVFFFFFRELTVFIILCVRIHNKINTGTFHTPHKKCCQTIVKKAIMKKRLICQQKATFSIASTSATEGIMSGMNGFSCRRSSMVWGVNLTRQHNRYRLLETFHSKYSRCGSSSVTIKIVSYYTLPPSQHGEEAAWAGKTFSPTPTAPAHGQIAT